MKWSLMQLNKLRNLGQLQVNETIELPAAYRPPSGYPGGATCARSCKCIVYIESINIQSPDYR